MPRTDNTKFYASALSKHGLTPQGIHWNSRESQETRFKILCRFLPRELKSSTLADAGCGFGDLYLFLQRRSTPPKRYIGLEVMPEIAGEARARTGCEILERDILTDPLPEADYYLCSGAMNILTRFETHLFIRRCFEASSRGFIFNLLEGDDASMVYNYFQPEEIKQLGSKLGAKVKINRGYLPRDFTVAFYK